MTKRKSAPEIDSIPIEITCPHCGRHGRLGTSGFDRTLWKYRRDHRSTKLPYVLCSCGKPLTATIDQFVLSRDPWFRFTGLLGSGSSYPLMDKGFMPSLEIPGKPKILVPGTYVFEFRDPITGKLINKETRKLRDRGGFMVRPGIVKTVALRAACDLVLAVGLGVAQTDPEIARHVRLFPGVNRNADGLFDSISVACAVDDPALVKRAPFEVSCVVYVIRDSSHVRTWLRLLTEAVGQHMNGANDSALLGFAKATESFAMDFSSEVLTQKYRTPNRVVEALLKQCDRTSDLLGILVPAVLGKPLPPDVLKDWREKVAEVRNKRIAHPARPKTEDSTNAADAQTSAPVSDDMAQAAFEATYRLIRVIQSGCPFPQGRKFEYWRHPRALAPATSTTDRSEQTLRNES